MSPEVHLLTSWLIAAKSTNHHRDCRLIALAGIAPDADGLGLIADLITRSTMFYHQFHHLLLHGLFGALLVSSIAATFARERWRVFLLCLVVFHIHILCDFLGSRGPAPEDLWPIHYFGPFSRTPVWFWKGQWALDAWQNRLFGVIILGLALWLPLRIGHSIVGIFSRKADARVVEVLRDWRSSLNASATRFRKPASR